VNPQVRTTFADAVLAEWTKLRSVRSTAWSLLAAVALGVGFAVPFGLGAVQDFLGGTAEERAAFDPTAVGLRTHLFVQLAVAVLGVLVVTSEYATGTIGSALAAVPRRLRLLAAKAVVAGGVALVAGGLVLLVSFLLVQAVLAGSAPQAALDRPDVLRAVLGGALYLALVALGAVAVGVLVRSTAGAVTVMLSATLLVPAFTPILPKGLAVLVGTFWPTLAGNRIMTVVHDPGVLAPWTGLAVMGAWVAVLLVAAGAVLQRRDA
jgi:hypothetical protein